MKPERVTTKAKMVTIKELENTIVSLGVDPIDTSHSIVVLKKKDNEITHMRKQRKIHVV